jgi:hypothetical protein
MKIIRLLALLLLLATLLTSCVISVGDSSVLNFLSVQDGSVVVHARSGPDATITAAGDLTIDGKPVATTTEQQALLKQYYDQALAIRAEGVATGVAAASLAHKAVSNVATGLAHGNSDSIGPRIEAEAKTVKAQAMKVCDAVAELRKTQDALVASLPAFKPYALIDANQAADCLSK